MWNETLEEATETKEGAKFAETGRVRPRLNLLEFVVSRTYGAVGKEVSAELEFENCEDAFGRFAKERMFLETVEDESKMEEVIVSGFGVNEDVIDVGTGEDAEEVTEDVVHEALEGGWSVHEAEGHDGVFEEALWNDEGGFEGVFRSEANLMETGVEVELGEVASFGQSGDEVGDVRKGITIGDGNVVELAVVDAHAVGAVFLFDEEDVGGEW